MLSGFSPNMLNSAKAYTDNVRKVWYPRRTEILSPAERLKYLPYTAKVYEELDNFSSGWDMGTPATVDGVNCLFMNTATNKILTKALGSVPTQRIKAVIRFWVDDATKLSDIRLYFYDSTFTNGYGATFGGITTSGWNYRTVAISAMGPIGAPVWANLANIRVRITPTVGAGGCNVYLASIALFDPKAYFTIWVDGGHESILSAAAPAMDAMGFQGTVALIGLMDKYDAGYLDRKGIMDLVAYGWDVANHTYSHTSLPIDATATAIEYEILKGLEMAQSVSPSPANHYVVPPGGWNVPVPNVKAVAQKYCTAYRHDSGTLDYSISTFDWMNLNCLVADNYSVAEVCGWIDTAIAQGKWQIALFHGIDALGGHTAANFQLILDYLAAHEADIETLPASEVIARI